MDDEAVGEQVAGVADVPRQRAVVEQPLAHRHQRLAHLLGERDGEGGVGVRAGQARYVMIVSVP
jgi:hypothetical protein